MALKNKNILIISPEKWGTMFLSKHHYAVELAKLGNTVYFLNSPKDGWHINKPKITIEKSGFDNLFIINYSLFFPYNLKFHLYFLYRLLIRIHIFLIKKKINRKLDIVWSFDFGNSFPLHIFKKSIRIFHPVDDPKNSKWAYQCAQSAHYIFSVTTEILDRYSSLKKPLYFINHGVSPGFILPSPTEYFTNSKIKVGYSGNLLRKDIDYPTLISIVAESPEVSFYFWGCYHSSQSNIGGDDNYQISIYINQLRSLPNVTLIGPIPQNELAVELNKCDAFILCYDIKRDPSNGTNYHKVMEYLSTGKVLISNNITTYAGIPHLIEMANSREDNNELPKLFKNTIANLEFYNSKDLCAKRIDYSRKHTYTNNVLTIEKLIFKTI
jgi:hypothetical protein